MQVPSLVRGALHTITVQADPVLELVDLRVTQVLAAALSGQLLCGKSLMLRARACILTAPTWRNTTPLHNTTQMVYYCEKSHKRIWSNYQHLPFTWLEA